MPCQGVIAASSNHWPRQGRCGILWCQPAAGLRHRPVHINACILQVIRRYASSKDAAYVTPYKEESAITVELSGYHGLTGKPAT